MNIISEERDDFEEVLSIEKLDDLEDGLQMQCAKKMNLDYILTENIKDFAGSEVQPILTADFLRFVDAE